MKYSKGPSDEKDFTQPKINYDEGLEYKRLLEEQNEEAETIITIKTNCLRELNANDELIKEVRLSDDGRVYEGLDQAVNDKPCRNMDESNLPDIEDLVAVRDVVEG